MQRSGNNNFTVAVSVETYGRTTVSQLLFFGRRLKQRVSLKQLLDAVGPHWQLTQPAPVFGLCQSFRS